MRLASTLLCLFAVRLILEMCEGCITMGFMIVVPCFTPGEYKTRVDFGVRTVINCLLPPYSHFNRSNVLDLA